MATSTVSRLAPVTARDGVNTRKKENWARVATQPQKTICRSDTIIGLGNPAVTNWGDMMTGMYETRSTSRITRTERSAIALYRDMADEMWKYSDADMFAWLELDETLRAGPERVDVEAYWADREVLELAEQACAEERYRAEKDALRARFRAVAQETAKLCMKRWIDRDIKAIVKRFKICPTKIQAAVRGYQARCKDPHQDCCMCLSHRISPLKTAVGYMCRSCAEMGPHKDLVEEDPRNWHRAEYVDEAPHHSNACVWCNQQFPLMSDWCSYECQQKDLTS